MTRTLAQCGTDSAYKRHAKASEPVDAACAVAHNDYMRAYRAQRRRSTLLRQVRAASLAGDDLRILCARLDASGWPVSQIAKVFGLSREGATGAVQEGRRILIARRRTGVAA